MTSCYRAFLACCLTALLLALIAAPNALAAPVCAADQTFNACSGTASACSTYNATGTCSAAGCTWGSINVNQTVWKENFTSYADWATYSTSGNGISQETSSSNCVNDADDHCIRTDGGTTSYNLTKQSSLNLTSCAPGTAKLNINHVQEDGNLESNDCVYVWFSANNGTTWSNKTTVFCDDNPSSSFSTTLSNGLLTNGFRMRIEKQNFDDNTGTDEAAYLDDINVTCGLPTPACTGSPSACNTRGNESACIASSCTVACRDLTFCGDGIKQTPNDNGQTEACDDGNNATGDGCSAACALEANYTCSGSPSVCSRVNPTLANSCGIDMVLIIDSSGSIDNGELAQMKTAFNGFVDAFLPNTPSQIAVIDFDDTASLTRAYTSNATLVKNAINAASSGGATNWEDALEEAHAQFDHRASKPDLFIFASDGNPNRYGDGPTTASESVAMAQALQDADAIKADGIRIVTLGIGNDLNASNLQAISSADAYYSSDFGTLATTLSAIADDLCGGTVTVRKLVDGVPAANWTFNISVTGGTSAPTQAVTDNDGFATFNVNMSGANATAGVTETLKAGYNLTNASCIVNNAQRGVRSGTSVNGISMLADDAVFCQFDNHLLPFCGDGQINQGNETCDGNAGVGAHQACAANCTIISLTYCGDGIKQTPNDADQNESCDGASGTPAHYSCTANCSLDYVPYCGDALVNQANETCDAGINNNVACTPAYGGSCEYCSGTCQTANVTGPYCGDQIVNGNETCEAGDAIADPEHYTCDAQTCTLTYNPYCGDNNVDQGEECDGANGTSEHYTCTQNCELEYVPYCGDGQVNTQDEECDGSAPEHYTCEEDCSLTYLPYCGDGNLDQGESCDGLAGVGEHQACDDQCNLNDLTYCGDGEQQIPNDENVSEQCDGQDGIDEHSVCEPDCTLTRIPYCGDGIVDQGEECDGSAPEGSACSSACELIACDATGTLGEGESVTQTVYGIDHELTLVFLNDSTPDTADFSFDGELTGELAQGETFTSSLNSDLTLTAGDVVASERGGSAQYCLNVPAPFCGDNVANQDNETCDGQEGVPKHYTCTQNCELEYVPYCGDNNVDQGEECDGSAPEHYTCEEDCSLTYLPYCGDGQVNTQSETCDDGNNSDGDGCNANCGVEFCGDYVMNNNGTEMCDNGAVNGIACTPQYGSTCSYCGAQCAPVNVTGPYCGDQIVNGNEACDGDAPDNYICTQNCELAYVPYCGDGNLDQGEECDGNAGVGEHQACDDSCQLHGLPYCGDGELNEGEECDTTAPEHYTCDANCGLHYIPYCGDGQVNTQSETCDDGNNIDGDGCDAQCQPESGITCEEALQQGLLHGEIIDGNAVVVNDANASFNVSLASYEMYALLIDDQVLHDSATTQVDANSNTTLGVELPACAYQIDLVCGTPLPSNPQYPAEQKLDFNFGNEDAGFCVPPGRDDNSTVTVTTADGFPQCSDYVFTCDVEGFEPTSYSWYFGDGDIQPDSGNQDVYHTYAANGTYIVTCTATDGEHTQSGSLAVEAHTCPTCEQALARGLLHGAITDNGTAIVANEGERPYLVTLASYEMFGATLGDQALFDQDAQNVPAGGVAAFAVDAPACANQIDLVCGDARVVNPDYADSEKIDSDITLQGEWCAPHDGGNAGDATIDLSVQDGFPHNENYVFVCDVEGFTPSAYYWYYGDGSSLPNTTNANVYHTYTQDGTFTVACTATNGTASVTDTLNVTVVPRCGDGRVNQESEQCDGAAGLPSADYACTSECSLALTCEGATRQGLLTASIENGTAMVANGADESFNVSLASYEMYAPLIEDQVLHDSASLTVEGHGNATLGVELPACAYQIDLVCDEPLPFVPLYGDRVVAFHFGNEDADYCVPGPRDQDANVAVTIADGFPQDESYVFVCNATGFTPSAYYWYFGDGDISPNVTNSDVWHEYTENGNFTVACTATDGTTWQTGTTSVTVESIVPPSVEVTIEGQQGSELAFLCTGNGFTPTSFDWNFGDGSGVNDLLVDDATHAYSANGNYTVTCSASDNAQSVSGSTVIGIDVCHEYELAITQVTPDPAEPGATVHVSGTLSADGQPAEGDIVSVTIDGAQANASVLIGQWLADIPAPSVTGEYGVHAVFSGACGEAAGAESSVTVGLPEPDTIDEGSDGTQQGEQQQTLLANGGSASGDCAWGYHTAGGVCVKDAPEAIASDAKSGVANGGDGADGLLPDETPVDGDEGTGDESNGLTGAFLGGALAASWSWLLLLLLVVLALVTGAWGWHKAK